MPQRFVPFVNNEYYHVFNRGVNKRKIFLDPSDYNKAVEILEYYLFSGHTQRFSYYARLSQSNKKSYFKNITNQMAALVSYVLMPNHFHLLISQTEENGISNFLSLFQNSYTRYFNIKHKRIGHLFQGQFKATHIEDNSQLIHVSRYIHLNPLSSHVVNSIDELEKYQWSSYPSYLNPRTLQSNHIQNNIVLEQFQKQTYKNFVTERSLYQQELEDIKHLTID